MSIEIKNEWWEDEKYNWFDEVTVSMPKPQIALILQEQKKRDWAEFREMIEELIEENKLLMERDSELDAGMIYIRDVLKIRSSKIDSKLSSLKSGK